MSFMIAGAPKVRSNQVSAFGQKYFAQSFIRKDAEVKRCEAIRYQPLGKIFLSKATLKKMLRSKV